MRVIGAETDCVEVLCAFACCDAHNYLHVNLW